LPKRPLGLLSLGIFIVIVAVNLILFFPDWNAIFSLVLTLYGLWVMFLSGIRAKTPVKYERGAFSTLVWGILLIAIGGAWFLMRIEWLYSITFLLAVIGILAVVSALRAWQK
jgi:hypothetical protein